MIFLLVIVLFGIRLQGGVFSLYLERNTVHEGTARVHMRCGEYCEQHRCGCATSNWYKGKTIYHSPQSISRQISRKHFEDIPLKGLTSICESLSSVRVYIDDEFLLVIRNVTFPEDQGYYCCDTGHNFMSELLIYCTFLDVQVPVSDPMFLDEHNNILANAVMEGQMHTLLCFVSRGMPVPNFKWTLADEDVNATHTAIKRLSTFSYNINRNLDQKIVTCTVWNGIGPQRRVTLRLKVLCRPRFHETNCFGVFTVEEHDNYTISVIFYSQASYHNLTWIHGQQSTEHVLSPAHQYRLEEYSSINLTIDGHVSTEAGYKTTLTLLDTQPSDSGQYIVNVSNDAGSSICTQEILVTSTNRSLGTTETGHNDQEYLNDHNMGVVLPLAILALFMPMGIALSIWGGNMLKRRRTSANSVNRMYGAYAIRRLGTDDDYLSPVPGSLQQQQQQQKPELESIYIEVY